MRTEKWLCKPNQAPGNSPGWTTLDLRQAKILPLLYYVTSGRSDNTHPLLLLITSLQLITHLMEPDLDNTVINLTPSTWDPNRLILVQSGSKIQRFRTETYWYNNITLCSDLKESNLMVIVVRAIGPRTKAIKPAETALLNALETLDIMPSLIQQQQQDSQWPCQWIVQFAANDTPKLPKYSDSNQGVFWNKKGNVFLIFMRTTC